MACVHGALSPEAFRRLPCSSRPAVFTLAGHVSGQLLGRMGWVGALDIRQHRRKKKRIVYRVPRAPILLCRNWVTEVSGDAR